MSLLYSIGIQLYGFLILISSLFNSKAKKWITGRKDLLINLEIAFEEDPKCIWVHCASLGEFEQGRPLIEALKKERPNHKILLTFFSPSGYEIRKNYTGADFIYYLPLDTSYNAKRFIEITNPEFAVFIKYEFWPNYISTLYKKNIPLYIASAIFRENQVFFKPWGKWMQSTLKKVNHIFVQNQESIKLLNAIGVDKVSISGDTRFDRVSDVLQSPNSIPLIKEFKGMHPLFIAGSTWAEDEKILIELINHSDSSKFIIAPHEINERSIESFIQKLTKKTLKLDDLTAENVEQTQVLIINKIGILAHLYQYADMGYIGGGFGAGIHNTLEAAAFGMPLFFGPNYHKFKEAKDLVKLKAAFPIEDKENLIKHYTTFITNKTLLADTSAKSKRYVAENIGATQTIINHILK